MLLLLAPPTPPAASEMLTLNVPSDYRVAYSVRAGAQEMIEVVKPPETVENWSMLATNVIIHGGAKAGVEKYNTTWRKLFKKACPGASDTVVTGKVDGMPALKTTLACPRNPKTGKPENLVAVAVQGQTDMLMVQVAYRRELTPDDEALAAHIVGGLKVCTSLTLAECRSRVATGFVVD